MDIRYQQIIKAYFEGRLDSEQTKVLAEWLYSSPEAVVEFKAELKRLREIPSADESAEAFLEKFNAVRSRRRSRRIFRGLCIGAAVSACITAVVVCTLYFSNQVAVKGTETVMPVAQADMTLPEQTVSSPEVEKAKVTLKLYQAPKSSKMPVTLPDGTSVTLNKGARLSLGKSFGHSSRAVNLDGEAFFDVAKDPKKPFVITCGEHNYVVKGTSFNIMSYSEDNYSVVTLHTGSLAAYINGDTLLLSPGDELSVDNEDGEMRRRKVDVTKSTRWMSDDALHFSSLPLKVVASQMSKKYGVCIHVNPSISNILYEGVIDDEPLSVALRLLSITAPEPLAVEKLNDSDYYIKKLNTL